EKGGNTLESGYSHRAILLPVSGQSREAGSGRERQVRGSRPAAVTRSACDRALKQTVTLPYHLDGATREFLHAALGAGCMHLQIWSPYMGSARWRYDGVRVIG